MRQQALYCDQLLINSSSKTPSLHKDTFAHSVSLLSQSPCFPCLFAAVSNSRVVLHGGIGLRILVESLVPCLAQAILVSNREAPKLQPQPAEVVASSSRWAQGRSHLGLEALGSRAGKVSRWKGCSSGHRGLQVPRSRVGTCLRDTGWGGDSPWGTAALKIYLLPAYWQ